MAKKKYEITSIGVRDDKVVNKGKAVFGVGALLAAVGGVIMLSGRQWMKPDDFYANVGYPEKDAEETE